MSDPFEHSAELLRLGDKDRFLANLFAPDEKRLHLMALHAFNLEIARIADAVSEPQLGLIRQQWWHDTIDAGGGASHPVAIALDRTVAACKLPRKALHDLISAHEFDLHDEAMADLMALETYLGRTSSALIQLGGMILTGPAAARAAEAAGLAGVAFGLSRIVSGIRADPRRFRKFLPRDLIAEEGEDVAIERLALHALRRLNEARGMPLPEGVLPAFLPVALTGHYLRRARPPSQFRRQIALWWAALNDRF